MGHAGCRDIAGHGSRRRPASCMHGGSVRDRSIAAITSFNAMGSCDAFDWPQAQRQVRRVAASLSPRAIALYHEHACDSLETIAQWAKDLGEGDGNSAALAALAREVREQLASRIAAQLVASTRPVVRRAATVAVLQLAETFGPLDLADWLWTAERLLPPMLMLARKETDAAATAELIVLSAAMGGPAGAAFVGTSAARAADCARGRGPWRRLMAGALGEGQAVWLLHRVLELGCQGTLSSAALIGVVQRAPTIVQAVRFCTQSAPEPRARDVAARSLRLLQQLLDATDNSDVLQQPQKQQLATPGVSRLNDTERQVRELSKIRATLRQAVSPHCGRTLYGQPIQSWECVFKVIVQAEHGLDYVNLNESAVECIELTRALDRLGLGFSHRQITSLFETIDGDGDGSISFSEFHLYLFGRPYGSECSESIPTMPDESLSESDYTESEQEQQLSEKRFGMQSGLKPPKAERLDPEQEAEQQSQTSLHPLSRSAHRYVNSLWRSLDRLNQEPPAAVLEATAGGRERIATGNETTAGNRSPIENSDEVSSIRRSTAVDTVRREQHTKLVHEIRRQEQQKKQGHTGAALSSCSVDTQARQSSTDVVRRMMRLQEAAGQLLAAEAAASQAESAMWELRSRPSNYDEELLSTVSSARGDIFAAHATPDCWNHGRRNVSTATSSVAVQVTTTGRTEASFEELETDSREDLPAELHQSGQSLQLSLEGEGERDASNNEADTSGSEETEEWSPQRASVRVASAASAAVAAAAVEEVARLRAELADKDRQIVELLRSKENNR